MRKGNGGSGEDREASRIIEVKGED